MTRFQPPVVPFVESHHKGKKQRPSLIMLHLSETTSEKGAALGIANYWHQPFSPEDAACHYVVDESAQFRCVPDKFQCGGSKGVLHITMCALPTTSELVWDGESYSNVLIRTADLVAQLCLAYKIHPRILDSEQFDRWFRFKSRRRSGIGIHLPGVWPRSRFLALVQERILETRGKR